MNLYLYSLYRNLFWNIFTSINPLFPFVHYKIFQFVQLKKFYAKKKRKCYSVVTLRYSALAALAPTTRHSGHSESLPDTSISSEAVHTELPFSSLCTGEGSCECAQSNEIWGKKKVVPRFSMPGWRFFPRSILCAQRMCSSKLRPEVQIRDKFSEWGRSSSRKSWFRLRPTSLFRTIVKPDVAT